MDQRQERMLFETARHRVIGDVTLARDGYRSRFSDMLNASERHFIPLTNVSIEPIEGGPAASHPFLALARAHIIYATTLSETTTLSEAG